MATLALPATVTVREANSTLHELTQSLRGEQGGALAIDASALRQFDSAALAVLLECMRRAQAANKSLVVERAPAKLIELARLYGVDELLALTT